MASPAAKPHRRPRNDFNIVLDPAHALSLQQQLRQKIVDAICRGVLRPGRRLPSSRQLAQRIGVSRNTVSLAYDALLSEGHLTSRARSGFYVAQGMETGRVAAGHRPPPGRSRLTSRLAAPAGADGFHCPDNWHQFPFPFVDGRVDAQLLPLDKWRESLRLACSRQDATTWNQGAGDIDDLGLLDEIRTKILPMRGIEAGPDELLVAQSTRHALQLVVDLLVRRGTPVVLEQPCDAELLRRLRERQADIRMVEVLSPRALPDCAVVITSPRRSFAMRGMRPEALLAAIADADGILVELDPPRTAPKARRMTPATRALDSDGRVAHIAGLSATVSSGEPPGVVVADAAFIERLRQVRRNQGTPPPVVMQRAWAYFIGLGHYAAALAQTAGQLEGRMRALRDALNHYLHEAVSIEPLPGDTAYWVSAPRGHDAAELAFQAAAGGILLEPMRLDGRDGFCMGVTALPESRIRVGVHALARLVRTRFASAPRALEDDSIAPLRGRALRQAISGAVLLYNTVYGDPCTLEVRRDGELIGVAGRAGEDCDRGRWWIEGDRWFRQWQQWAYGEAADYAIVVEGDQLRWYDADGLLVDTAVLTRAPRKARTPG